ncbi:hypothetical protein [Mucilaginibacter paludis]|uniref:N-acetyltransferase domain-containing protein n=1 Tax=Mucilaginibacter paludis DSM 18603 TaxID=714943 RepID=H1YB37_9SPHI|nr:hypothetical protein [Mucilaginibacter paludis]EHQ30070.1 hypothetical protein Mucpa_6011 [Mucilaginibacter paludis DSM 18603]
MKVKIIKVITAEEVVALIKKGTVAEMPSIQQGWRFNFDKELKKLKNATGYLLVTEESPDIIEGCMIFQLIDKKAPYMAFVEVAPHNKKDNRKYERVAGCLIAYAYQLSITQGWEHFKGYLQFDVLEQNKEDETKLMSIYSSKYHAKRVGQTTTMVIVDEDGEELVAEYLQAPK